MILSMIESAKVPQIGQPNQPGFAVDVIPVDYLAQGFLALTSEKEALPSGTAAANYNKPNIYHIGNHTPLKLAELPEIVARLRPDGKRAEVVSLDDWLRSMDSGNEDEAAVRNTVLKEYLATGYVMFSLDNSKTSALLETLVPGLDEKCPAVDAEFLGQLWQRIKKAEVAKA